MDDLNFKLTSAVRSYDIIAALNKIEKEIDNPNQARFASGPNQVKKHRSKKWKNGIKTKNKKK